MNIFIFGAGYSAKRIGALAAKQGAKVVGTTRSAEKADALRGFGIEPLIFSETSDTNGICEALAGTTHLIVSIAPGESGDPVLRAFATPIAQWAPKLEWIGYLSTVGVYGDYLGGWVNEESQCLPVSRRSVERVEAEELWTRTAKDAGIPLTILRLSGIYGPGRNAFVNLTNGTAKRLVKKDQVFNRIHVDDIAGAAWRLAKSNTGGIFNVTDDEPAPPQDVVAYAASLMSVDPPPEIPFETAQLSPMARSFYGENKRVSNGKLKAAGYDFAYPNYRTAFDTMWRDGNWADGEPRSPMRT